MLVHVGHFADRLVPLCTDGADEVDLFLSVVVALFFTLVQLDGLFYYEC